MSECQNTFFLLRSCDVICIATRKIVCRKIICLLKAQSLKIFSNFSISKFKNFSKINSEYLHDHWFHSGLDLYIYWVTWNTWAMDGKLMQRSKYFCVHEKRRKIFNWISQIYFNQTYGFKILQTLSEIMTNL